MATKIPKSARMTFSLNAGINPGTGTMKKEVVSMSRAMPGSETAAIGAVTDAIKALFLKPVVSAGWVETSIIA